MVRWTYSAYIFMTSLMSTAAKLIAPAGMISSLEALVLNVGGAAAASTSAGLGTVGGLLGTAMRLAGTLVPGGLLGTAIFRSGATPGAGGAATVVVSVGTTTVGPGPGG